MIKRIRTEGGVFIDCTGKPFMPKGVNMVCKDRSEGYIGHYTEEDFYRLKKNGFNLIRFGIFVREGDV